MKLKDYQIAKQLHFTQLAIMILVLAMGIISYIAADRLWESAVALHDHPFTTQGALASTQRDILKMRLIMEQVVLENGKSELQTETAAMDAYAADSMKQINILYKSYLGPENEIDNMKKAIVDYQSIRQETLRLVTAGKLDEAKQRVRFDGICGVQAQKIMNIIAKMDVFANNKADELYLTAQRQKNQTMLFLLIFVAASFVLLTGIIILLKKNIIPPLKELTVVVDNFDQGKLGIRSHYQSENELGTLSEAFNKMTERIEMDSREKIERAAELLLTKRENAALAELIKMQDKYFIEKQLFEATLLSIGDAVISSDNNGNVIFLNKVAEALTGWSQEEAIGESIETVFVIADEISKEKSENIVDKVIRSGQAAELANHTILINKDSREIPIEDSAAPIFRENGEIVGAVLVFRDVSDKRLKLKSIEYLSYHDNLTGLYNRRFYEIELARIDTAENLPLTLIMGDVNGLKLINDSFGHSMGDALLQKAAKAITKGCRTDDIIARLGGDEFIIILPKTGAAEAEKVIKRIKKTIAAEKVHDIEVSIAFGHGTKEVEKADMQELFKVVEDDMYRQKLYESSSMRSKTVDLIMSTLYEKNNRESSHSKRVSEISEAIAKKMDFDSEQVNQIRITGLMHDIGKIGINEKILNKVGKLDEAEFDEIKRHSEIGYRILNSVSEFSEISNFILAHHERWDGNGYPKGLKGEAIPTQSRIIAISDSYDAMISERTYKNAMSREEAAEEIKRCAGTQFDPEIVSVFIEHISDLTSL